MATKISVAYILDHGASNPVSEMAGINHGRYTAKRNYERDKISGESLCLSFGARLLGDIKSPLQPQSDTKTK